MNVRKEVRTAVAGVDAESVRFAELAVDDSALVQVRQARKLEAGALVDELAGASHQVLRLLEMKDHARTTCCFMDSTTWYMEPPSFVKKPALANHSHCSYARAEIPL